MRKLPVRKLPARKLLWAAVAGALFLPVQGFPLGLGEIEVNSSLNQRLSADIELLSATPEDSENLIVKLASRKDFTRAGLDRPYLLNDLRFKAVLVDGVPHINVSSGSPIREPFLNFLVEVDWPNGHLLREYTVLLDPPVFMMKQPGATAVSPAGSAGDAGFRPGAGGSANIVPVVIPGANGSPRPQAAAVQPVAVNNTYAAAPSMPSADSQPPGSYRIKQGDTAWSLADAMRPDQSVSVEQMMIAMLRANPESFIDENINGLKRGYILRTPDYDQIASISQADARALVREQAALWRQIQKARSGGQPGSAMPAQGYAADSDSTGGAVGDDSAYLEIVSAGSGSSAGSAKDPTMMSAEELRAELAVARERVETERVEKEALQQRIQLLESNVDTMKGMLSIEDEGLSDVQSLNAPAGEDFEAMQDDSGMTAEEIAARQELLEAIEGEMLEGQPGDVDAVRDAESALAEAADAEAVDAEAMAADEAVFIDEAATGEVVDMPAATSSDMPADMPADTAAAPASAIDRPEPDPLTKLLSDPILLAAAGGGLLLVIALIALLIKRRKAAAEEGNPETAPAAADDLESLADDVAVEAEAAQSAGDSDDGDDLVGILDDAEQQDTGEFDSDSTMILNSPDDTVITEAAEAVEEEVEDEPRDDVIAEADVYLAYGIYQQAEELLTQAIADNPDRDDYRVKLAETHYAGKDVEAFKRVAGEIRERAASDDVPAWKKVMVMGKDLCPDEAMFQGSMIGGVDVDSLAPKVPEMDFDLGINEAQSEVAPDLDLSLDEELELPDMDEGATQVLEADDLVQDLQEQADVTDELADDAVSAETAIDAADEIEFDITDTGAVEEAADTEDEFSLDIDASELDIDIQDETDALDKEESIDIDGIDIGLDIGDEAERSADEEHPIEDIDIDFGLDAADEMGTEGPLEENNIEGIDDDIEIDLTDESESLDMDFGEMEADNSLEAGVSAEPEIDISMDIDDVEAEGVNIEEGGIEEEIDAEQAAVEESAPEAAVESIEDEFDLSSLDDVDEVSTKLDLARAYLDMGDHEGSRGILEEVVAEGNDEQKKEARELMEKLD